MEEKDKKFEIMLLTGGSSEGSQENSWYLDTGASNHVCGKMSMFMELVTPRFPNVKISLNKSELIT